MWQEVGLGHSLHYVLNVYYLFTYGEDLRNDMNITWGTVRSRQGVDRALDKTGSVNWGASISPFSESMAVGGSPPTL